jgi:hypothetical protein
MKDPQLLAEYVAGFDDGCDYVIHEIKRIQRNQGDDLVIADVIAQLLKLKTSSEHVQHIQ